MVSNWDNLGSADVVCGIIDEPGRLLYSQRMLSHVPCSKNVSGEAEGWADWRCMPILVETGSGLRHTVSSWACGVSQLATRHNSSPEYFDPLVYTWIEARKR